MTRIKEFYPSERRVRKSLVESSIRKVALIQMIDEIIYKVDKINDLSRDQEKGLSGTPEKIRV
jgi:hypothetical protein